MLEPPAYSYVAFGFLIGVFFGQTVEKVNRGFPPKKPKGPREKRGQIRRTRSNGDGLTKKL
jgi:hypothetical protein